MQILDQYGKPIETREQRRSAGSNLMSPADWLIDALTGGATVSGQRVNETTALGIATFFACVRNISEDLTALPRRIMQAKGSSRETLPGHPVSRLMRRPSKKMNAFIFWQTYFSHALQWEGAYAYIVRDNGGVPVELVILDPSCVEVMTSREDGSLVYRVYNEILFAYEVLHLRGLGCMGVDGYRIAYIAREALGSALAIQSSRASFFGKGMLASGMLKHPAVLKDEARNRLKEDFHAAYAGSENAGRTILLEEGMEYQTISVDPDKAEMTGLTDITVEEVCRLFRMPPHKVQHLRDTSYNSVELLSIEYVGDALSPHTGRFEAEVDFKLLRPKELDDGLYTDVNLKAAMRASAAERVAFYKELYYLSAMNANEIRTLEDENPIKGGDRYFTQGNLVPLDRVDDMIDARMKPADTREVPPGAAGPASPPTQPGPSDTFRRMLEAKIWQLLREDLRIVDSYAGKKRDWPDFYEKRQVTMTEHLTPFLSPLCEWFGHRIPASAMADGLATTLCRDSLILIDACEFSDWRDGRRAVDAAQSVMDALQEIQNENAA